MTVIAVSRCGLSRRLRVRWFFVEEITLEDDEKITAMAATHDDRVTSPTNRNTNEAVSWGQAAAAGDGNIYVMRWLSPAIFYGISRGGQVLRRVEANSEEDNFTPVSRHITGNRVAVLFYQPQTMEKVMKIVDLQGHELASYEELRAGGKAIPHRRYLDTSKTQKSPALASGAFYRNNSVIGEGGGAPDLPDQPSRLPSETSSPVPVPPSWVRSRRIRFAVRNPLPKLCRSGVRRR